MQEKVKINGEGIACEAVYELTKIYITLTSIYTKRKVFTNLLIKI